MKTTLLYIIGILIVCAMLYGGYWIAKNISYALFYRDMVQKTIVEMVEPNSLKK